MKNIVLALLVATLSVGVGGRAAEAATCELVVTGPESKNICKIDDDTDIRYECDINVDVTNDNDQDAESGQANNSNNTSAGDTTTGDASNSNEVDNRIKAECDPIAASVKDSKKHRDDKKKDQKEQPKEQLGENGQVQGAAIEQPQQVAALPETGENDIITLAASAVGGIGIVAIVLRFATSALKSRL